MKQFHAPFFPPDILKLQVKSPSIWSCLSVCTTVGLNLVGGWWCWPAPIILVWCPMVSQKTPSLSSNDGSTKASSFPYIMSYIHVVCSGRSPKILYLKSLRIIYLFIFFFNESIYPFSPFPFFFYGSLPPRRWL